MKRKCPKCGAVMRRLWIKITVTEDGKKKKTMRGVGWICLNCGKTIIDSDLVKRKRVVSSKKSENSYLQEKILSMFKDRVYIQKSMLVSSLVREGFSREDIDRALSELAARGVISVGTTLISRKTRTI